MKELKQFVKDAYLDANNNAEKSNDAISTSLNFDEFWSENENKFKNLALSDVHGCFNHNYKLNQLIEKWELNADRIKSMADNVKNPKSQRKVFNHFLIQLYKCIGEAKIEMKTNYGKLFKKNK